QPEQSLGQAEARALGADQDVAAERDLEAAAERIAVERRNGGLRQRLELVEDAPALELVRIERRKAMAAIFGDIGAGDERLLARPGEDHRAHRAIGGDGVERRL